MAKKTLQDLSELKKSLPVQRKPKFFSTYERPELEVKKGVKIWRPTQLFLNGDIEDKWGMTPFKKTKKGTFMFKVEEADKIAPLPVVKPDGPGLTCFFVGIAPVNWTCFEIIKVLAGGKAAMVKPIKGKMIDIKEVFTSG